MGHRDDVDVISLNGIDDVVGKAMYPHSASTWSILGTRLWKPESYLDGGFERPTEILAYGL